MAYGFDDERLRADLRDYYGTAMFNGNPMAMMELEEVERASSDELRRMAPAAGIDPSRYDSPSWGSPSYGGGSGWSSSGGSGWGSSSGSGSIGVSVSARYERISSEATNFFDSCTGNVGHSSKTSSPSGFFASYSQALYERSLRDEDGHIEDNGEVSAF
ncbi:MAG: hypothetical protein IKV48_05055 [Eggerthellaceae bacterium]|nr:hypothetical protein [Eggerthellaceae bacterium]